LSCGEIMYTFQIFAIMTGMKQITASIRNISQRAATRASLISS
jgi:hypothetical protein